MGHLQVFAGKGDANLIAHSICPHEGRLPRNGHEQMQVHKHRGSSIRVKRPIRPRFLQRLGLLVRGGQAHILALRESPFAEDG